MDLKIGTSTLTLNAQAKKDSAKVEKRKIKDAETTSAQHGFKVVGYKLRNGEGKDAETFVKKPFLTIEQSVEKLK